MKRIQYTESMPFEANTYTSYTLLHLYAVGQSYFDSKGRLILDKTLYRLYS